MMSLAFSQALSRYLFAAECFPTWS